MKLTLGSWVLLIALSACNTPKKLIVCDTCLQMEDSIASFWKYDSLELHYTGSYNWLAEINFKNNKFRSCLISKDSSYIVKLFGDKFISMKTNDSSARWLVYKTSKPCTGHGREYHCSELKFLLNAKSIVENVLFYELMSRDILDFNPNYKK